MTISSRGLVRRPRSATVAVPTAEGTWGRPSRVTGGIRGDACVPSPVGFGRGRRAKQKVTDVDSMVSSNFFSGNLYVV